MPKQSHMKKVLTMITIAVLLEGVSFSKMMAQRYALRRVSETENYLQLKTGSTTNEWSLPYPVYQLQCGDVDGDGKEDAIVGVIKGSRFFPEVNKRMFIFKNVKGKIRPMWLGSKLGGLLQDFRLIDGIIRSIETSGDNRWFVAEWQWDDFGPAFIRFLIKDTDEHTARETFNQ